jgi:hypothetical protein
VVPPLAAIELLYATPTVPPGSTVVVMVTGLGATEAAILIRRLDVADSAVGVVESVTVIAADTLPAAVGVPEITPVKALIDNPLGRPFALYL